MLTLDSAHSRFIVLENQKETKKKVVLEQRARAVQSRFKA